MDQPTGAELLRRGIAAIPPYNAGLSAERVRREYGVEQVVKLASNENPLGMSPTAAAALASAASAAGLYPDPHCTALRTAIAKSLNVDMDRLAFGNGSEELIAIACRAFLDPGDRVVLSSPTFSVCADNALVMGAHIVDVPRLSDFRLDVDQVVRAITPDTKLLYLCNPNNPTGTMIGREDFERICAAAGARTLIIVDEAYFEYARKEDDYPDSLAYLPATKAAWLVLRTFSKAYGLAGLRVGYGIASNAIIARQLDIVRTAFNVNHMAQMAALAAWHDQDHVAKSVAHNAAERRRIDTELRERGFAPASSATNFLFLDTGRPSRTVMEEFLRQGVIVKPWGGACGTFIRVSIGTAEENDRFLAALDAGPGPVTAS